MPLCRHTLTRLILVLRALSTERVVQGSAVHASDRSYPQQERTVLSLMRGSLPCLESTIRNPPMKVISCARLESASRVSFACSQGRITVTSSTLRRVCGSGCFVGNRAKRYRPFLCRDCRLDGACRGGGRSSPICFSKSSSTLFPMTKRYPKLRQISVVDRKTDAPCPVSRVSPRLVICRCFRCTGVAGVFDSENFSTSN